MHKNWCGKACCECRHPCTLDENLYCSPDCEQLGPNGEVDFRKCRGCDVLAAMIEDSMPFERLLEIFMDYVEHDALINGNDEVRKTLIEVCDVDADEATALGLTYLLE